MPKFDSCPKLSTFGNTIRPFVFIMENRSVTSEAPSSPEIPGLAAREAPIHLQVGERRFTTARATLTEESGFFAALLSGRWENALQDGSYFIDADPNLFQHILAYLRRGVFPLFDGAQGHDHHRYLALLEEARYFQIPQLEAWLSNKHYMMAAQVTYKAEEYDEDDPRWRTVTTAAGKTVEYHPQWATRKVYLCPRGIPEHRDNRTGCGRRCESARGDDGDQFEEELSLHILVIKREVAFNADVCVSRAAEE
ncbi:BTB/POZ protein [Chaetomium fimeti]|uniref:BTB/POZ protein n=1 Tax=Chaetomium fimeti TaxID=1854472 RepID=A0AAE0LNU9_9PEZI|nr:BTB/POZ protein [Chaetomium fimeti]